MHNIPVSAVHDASSVKSLFNFLDRKACGLSAVNLTYMRIKWWILQIAHAHVKTKKNHPHVVPNSVSVVSVKHKYRTFVFLAGTEAYKLKKVA